MFDVLEQPESKAAIRLAIQSAAAAAACFTLMQYWQMPEKFVGVLSAVLVVQPSVGNTLGEALQRLVATIIGCIVGIVCLSLLPSGYGTAAALALSMLVMNGIAGVRPQWRYGVVAAVALALGNDGDIYTTALDRSMSIGLGAALGAVVALAVWPVSASQQAQRAVNRALSYIAELLADAVAASLSADDSGDSNLPSNFHQALADARSAADGIKFGDNKQILARIDRTLRLYNSVLIVNRVAEQTNNVTADWQELQALVERVHEAACAVVRAAAGAGDVATTDLVEMRDALDKVTRRVTREVLDSSQEELLLNALVFGLKETVENVEASVADSSS